MTPWSKIILHHLTRFIALSQIKQLPARTTTQYAYKILNKFTIQWLNISIFLGLTEIPLGHYCVQ